ncbi:Hypothetical predicted protein [Lecanosticta acicola]|uniref:Uncharacterized protein n=1 Tax=Lecanosticta acicola TaxID=111012 RepID=A0AAI9E9F2_9PEZI|nr:Hypothetical predicted protein [Lecanosticta acicola]
MNTISIELRAIHVAGCPSRPELLANEAYIFPRDLARIMVIHRPSGIKQWARLPEMPVNDLRYRLAGPDQELYLRWRDRHGREEGWKMLSGPSVLREIGVDSHGRKLERDAERAIVICSRQM